MTVICTGTGNDSSSPIETGVLFFVSRANIGGVQLSTLELAKRLPEYGLQTAICTPGDGPFRRECERAGILHLWLSDKQLSRPGHILVTSRSLQNVRHFMLRNSLNIFASSTLDGGFFLGSKLLDIAKFVYFSRDLNGVFSSTGMLRRMVLRITVQCAHRWVCNSQFICDTLGPIVKRNDGRVIHNGIDLARFINSSREREALIGKVHWQIGMAATLTPIKEHTVLLHAFSRLIESGISATLHLAGADPMPSHPVERTLKALAQKLKIDDRIIWHGNVHDMVAFYSNIDVFVLTCSREAFGRVLVEAMASGLPVVGPRSGGPSEIIEEGRQGYLFTPGDAEDLAIVLENLLARPNLMFDMGISGRERAESQFDAKRMVAQVHNVLIDIPR